MLICAKLTNDFKCFGHCVRELIKLVSVLDTNYLNFIIGIPHFITIFGDISKIGKSYPLKPRKHV